MNVVLVHGIFDTGAIFKRLEAQLTKAGHRCFSPSLKPSDARHGIVDLAKKLELFISGNISNDTPIAIVGFSMGCIVARYYLYHLQGYQRTKAFFAIFGPHQGSILAYLYPGQGAADMRPGSNLLKNLDSVDISVGEFPIFIYWTPWDLMILPASSSRWAAGIEHKIYCPLHPLMVSNSTVCADVAQKLHSIATPQRSH